MGGHAALTGRAHAIAFLGVGQDHGGLPAVLGGGGIGAALFTAYQRFDYDVVLTILIVIIALIMLAELLANGLKKIFR